MPHTNSKSRFLLFCLFLFGAGAAYVFASSTGPAVITGVQATNIMGPGAQIVWMTDDPSDSTVYYDVTTASFSNTSTSRCDAGGMVTSHCINLTGLSASMAYFYKVRSINQAGYMAEQTGTFTSASASGGGGSGGSVPAAPTGLTSGTPTSGSIPLSWNASPTADKYNIYRKLSTDSVWPTMYMVQQSNTSYTDTSVSAATSYDYAVEACLSGHGCSARAYWPSIPTALALDTTAPPAPTGLSATVSSASQIVLTWNASIDPTVSGQLTSGVTRYKVYRDHNNSNSYPLSVSTTNLTETMLTAATTYSYAVTAVDAAGNESSSVYASTTTLPNTAPAPAPAPTPSPSPTSSTDTTPPSTPGNVSATAVSSSRIDLTWSGATDNVGVAGYKIFRNNTYLTGITGGGTNYSDTGVVAGTSYAYSVKAIDAAMNESSTSTNAYATTPTATSVTTTTTTATSAPSTTTTTSPTATATSTPTSMLVSATVSRGESYCEGSAAKTPVTFSATPFAGAFFRVTMNTYSNDTVPGTYALPNGTYYWQAFARSGYALSGITSDSFVLNKLCGTTTTSTTAVTTTTTPVANTAATIAPPPLTATAPQPATTIAPTENTAYIVLAGESIIHVPYNGTFNDPGAKGYYETGGIAVTPKRSLGGLNIAQPGTYTVHYQLFNSVGNLLAAKTRTVIVDPPVETTTAPSSVSIQPITTAVSPGVTSSPSDILSLFAQAPSVGTIATPEQYAHYCDDPAHQKECAQYAVKQIVAPEVNPAPVAPPVSPEIFTTMKSQSTLPGGAASPEELKAVCAQSAFAPSCADLYVTTHVLSREEANNNANQILAARKEEVQVLTERVGARMFQDSDGDGITDYDEVNIYHTDPNKSDTNGDGITDGQHLLLGTDPLLVISAVATSTSPKGADTTSQPAKPVLSSKIAYEDPKFSGDIKPELLKVTSIKTVPVNLPLEGTTSNRLALSGKALPNSFVTLFIFSDPIVVTVKADESGAWTYTLDKELPDGTHQVMSAITDQGGHILAKSEPLPFVKEAAAVSIGSPLLASQPEAPGFFSGGSLYVLIAILIVVFALAFILIGFIVRRRPSEQASVHSNTEKNNNDLFP